MNQKSKNIDPNKKHYFDKISLAEFIAVVRESMLEDHGPMILWEAEAGEDKAEEFLIIDVLPDGSGLKLKYNAALIKRTLGTSLTKIPEIFLKLQYKKFNYFSTAKLIKSGSEYHLSVGKEIFKSQQRSNYRIQASSYINISIIIDQQTYIGEDLSAGGISILIPQSLGPNFQVGKCYNDSRLEFNKSLYTIGKLKVLKAINEENDEIRLGICFENLPSKLESKLNQHINSEARVEQLLKKKTS